MHMVHVDCNCSYQPLLTGAGCCRASEWLICTTLEMCARTGALLLVSIGDLHNGRRIWQWMHMQHKQRTWQWRQGQCGSPVYGSHIATMDWRFCTIWKRPS